MTHLTIKGNLDKNYIQSAILEVYLLWGIPRNVEEILVIDNPKYFKVIEKRVPKRYLKEFRKIYQNDPTSMSLTSGKFDLVIISISKKNEQYLKKNKKALVGLILHELMHIRQGRRGLDRNIRADAIRAFTKFIPKLHKLPYPIEALNEWFASIGEMANYTLKDIYANHELIETGLGEYILEDYYNYYKVGSSPKKIPFFYEDFRKAKKEAPEKIISAVNFELTLISALVPLIRMARAGNKKAREFVDFIHNYYEAGFPEVSDALDPAIQFTSKGVKWSSSYRQKFFRLVFEGVWGLLR